MGATRSKLPEPPYDAIASIRDATDRVDVLNEKIRRQNASYEAKQNTETHGSDRSAAKGG
jgi:hypothetical protein